MLVSIIIRTYNEARHLPAVLEGISRQQKSSLKSEIIIVDSGSTDGSVQIAKQYNARVLHIKKEEFSFGRSLNLGCRMASGDVLVFISGHCVPKTNTWLERLVSPLVHDSISYAYGRQVGNEETRFSEYQLFKKYFPVTSSIPQDGFFCNNANAAIKKTVWSQYLFNEDITGLEDMELARRLYNSGLKIAYVADAAVYHLHKETWHKIKLRFEREAIALRHIMPEIHVRFTDFIRYYTSAVLLDATAALKERVLWKRIGEIAMFRLMQYWGGYLGNHEHKVISAQLKEKYFYPK
jgi:glycosyltransferase involved in cell wall biosynthesis